MSAPVSRRSFSPRDGGAVLPSDLSVSPHWAPPRGTGPPDAGPARVVPESSAQGPRNSYDYGPVDSDLVSASV